MKNKEENHVIKKKSYSTLLFGVTIVLLIAFVLGGVIFSMNTIFGRNEAKLQKQLELGEKYLSELDYEQAIIAFEAAIEIEPMSVEAYLGLASVYERQGYYEKAISVLEEGCDKTSNTRLQEKTNDIKYILNPGNEESADEDISSEPEENGFTIIDTNGDGRHDSDVEALQRIINEQLEYGAIVDTDLNSDQYKWEEGRLTEINWNGKGLAGEIYFKNIDSLQKLYLRVNNISKLNVKDNHELIVLDCFENGVMELDLSNNLMLEILKCEYNKLSVLDLRDMQNLKEVYCSCNQELVSIDVTNCVQLTTLECSITGLNELDLSTNKKLAKLICDKDIQVEGYPEE